MEIELPDDLANQIADWIGIYGACKSENENDGMCEHEKDSHCCRVGFCMEITERIRESVKNEEKLK